MKMSAENQLEIFQKLAGMTCTLFIATTTKCTRLRKVKVREIQEL